MTSTFQIESESTALISLSLSHLDTVNLLAGPFGCALQLTQQKLVTVLTRVLGAVHMIILQGFATQFFITLETWDFQGFLMVTTVRKFSATAFLGGLFFTNEHG